MGGLMYLVLASAACAVPAFWMWTACRDKLGRMADREQPRWGRAAAVAHAARGGALATMSLRAGLKQSAAAEPR